VTAGAECLSLDLLGRWLRVRCTRVEFKRDIASRYAACIFAPNVTGDGRPAPDLEIDVRFAADGSMSLLVTGQPTITVANEAELHDELDRSIVLGLQRLRPGLYVLHAAVLSWHRRAFVIAGASGDGKSTTSWGLLHHGARFVSDELAPIDLTTWLVHPFARALCLKRDPPLDYPLPASALRIGSCVHVPTAALPCATERTPQPVAGVVFVRHDPGRLRAELRRLSAAESAARLYASALNALAHDGRGFDSAVELASRWPAVALASGELKESCELLGNWMDSMVG
jgi:hypothetical protein